MARRRDASGERWASVGGRGFKLDPASTLAREQWLAVAETQGMAAGARILSAAAIDEESVAALFGERIETRHIAEFDPATGGITSLHVGDRSVPGSALIGIGHYAVVVRTS